jgi:hypothetical protein
LRIELVGSKVVQEEKRNRWKLFVHAFLLRQDGVLPVARSAAMFTARRKIQKEKGQEPDEFEESVAQVCFCCFEEICIFRSQWV